MNKGKKVFIAEYFTDNEKGEDVVYVYDKSHISSGDETTCDIRQAIYSGNLQKIACIIRINNKTGVVSNVTFGIDPKTGKEYEPIKIREIVNSTEYVKGIRNNSIEDYGRNPAAQIISTTMTNFKNKDKLRFIPPSKHKNVNEMSDWVTNYMKELNSDIKDVQYFRWGITGHVDVVAIDPDKFRKDKDEDKKGSVAFFDYGCMFTDSFKNPPQIALISENSDVKLNENALSCRINKRIDELRRGQEEKEQKLKDPELLSLLEQQQRNIKKVFGELAMFMKPPYLPQNYPIIYKFRLGQIEGESDCSYNSEIFYSETITNERLKRFAEFDKFCRNKNKMENIRNLENELKQSAHKAENL